MWHVPPEFVLYPVQVQDASRGMAGSKNDPASLMRVLMRHEKLEQAAELALRYLSAWQTQVRKLCLFSIGRHEALLTSLQ